MPDDMTKTAPPMGHNQGPLLEPEALMAEVRARNGHLANRAADLVAGVARWRERYADKDGRPVIPDDDAMRATVDFLGKQLKPHADAIEQARKDAKAPLLDVTRQLDAYFSVTLAGALADAMKTVRAAAEAYANRKAAEEAQRRREEAQRLAAEAARAAELARQTSNDATMERALDLEQQAIDTAQEARGARAGMDAAKTTGDLGGGASLAGRWVATVTDPKKVPRKFCEPSMTLINAEMRTNMVGGECKAVIAGVSFTFERSLRVR